MTSASFSGDIITGTPRLALIEAAERMFSGPSMAQPMSYADGGAVAVGYDHVFVGRRAGKLVVGVDGEALVLVIEAAH